MKPQGTTATECQPWRHTAREAQDTDTGHRSRGAKPGGHHLKPPVHTGERHKARKGRGSRYA